jgi:hypothetical protein
LRHKRLNFGKYAGICVNLMTVVNVAGLRRHDRLLTSKSSEGNVWFAGDFRVEFAAVILHRQPSWANVPERRNETSPVLIVSKLLMRVIKAHARWRWRA